MKRKFTLLMLAFFCAVVVKAQRWEQVWADEFNTPGLPDASKWSFEDWGPKAVNNELQRYVPNRKENCRVENGSLIIEARRDWYNGSEYSSARINSSKKGFWTYGRVEARMKLPGGYGTWPAFWMMPEDITKYGWNSEVNYWWPNSGEIDIMEYVGYDKNKIHGTVHSAKYYFKKGNQRTGTTDVSDAETAFHVYAIEWFADRVDFYVDNTKYFTVVNDGTGWESYPFNHDFHIIFNLAVGGDWGGVMGVDPNIWPKKLEVDYVRVYKQVACTSTSIPAKIESESYCQMNGIQSETCGEGGQDVGYIDNGDWMSYLITVPTTGIYNVSYRIASPNTGGKLRLDKDAGATVLGTIDVPNSGGWQTWKTVTNQVTLPAGTYYLGVNALAGGFNINWIDIQKATQSFYQKIEAESYASMNGVQVETCAEGGSDVGWIDATDWMSYNVNLPYSGTYTLKYRVASPNTTGSLILSKNSTDVNVVTVPNTSGWQNWTTISQNVILSAGAQSLALYAKTGGFNVNWWSLEYGANGTKSAHDEDVSSSFQAGNDAIMIYPNPVLNVLKVELSDKFNDSKIGIFDLSGREVLRTSANGESNIELNMSQLRSGIYMMNISNGSESKMIKVVKK